MKHLFSLAIVTLVSGMFVVSGSMPSSAGSAASKMGKSGAAAQTKQTGSRTSASSEHGSVRGTINGGGDFVNRCRTVKGKRICS